MKELTGIHSEEIIDDNTIHLVVFTPIKTRYSLRIWDELVTILELQSDCVLNGRAIT